MTSKACLHPLPKLALRHADKDHAVHTSGGLGPRQVVLIAFIVTLAEWNDDPACTTTATATAANRMAVAASFATITSMEFVRLLVALNPRAVTGPSCRRATTSAPPYAALAGSVGV